MPNEQKYTDMEGQAQPLTRLASASRQSIKTKQKCCTGARTELLYRFEFSCKTTSTDFAKSSFVYVQIKTNQMWKITSSAELNVISPYLDINKVAES